MMRALWLMLLLVGCSGGDLEAPRITYAPVSVTPTENFYITVESEPADAELTYWWSVDGEPRPKIKGPTVVQEVATEGDAWTVIVRQEKAGSQSPPASVDIPIVADRGEDTGSSTGGDTGSTTTDDTGSPPVHCRLGEQGCPARHCDAISIDGQGSGVYWFSGPEDLDKDYRARCFIEDGEAWQQVVTINEDSSAFSLTGDMWEKPCRDRSFGVDSLATSDWEDGFADEGVSMGVCTVPVGQIEICPITSSGGRYSCYRSGIIDSSGFSIVTLDERWTASEPMPLPTMGDRLPDASGSRDWFYTECVGEVSVEDGWEASVWSADSNGFRLGFTIDTDDDETVSVGVGFGNLEDGATSSSGAIRWGDGSPFCEAAWSVRVRVIH